MDGVPQKTRASLNLIVVGWFKLLNSLPAIALYQPSSTVIHWPFLLYSVPRIISHHQRTEVSWRTMINNQWRSFIFMNQYCKLSVTTNSHWRSFKNLNCPWPIVIINHKSILFILVCHWNCMHSGWLLLTGDSDSTGPSWAWDHSMQVECDLRGFTHWFHGLIEGMFRGFFVSVWPSPRPWIKKVSQDLTSLSLCICVRF